MVVPLTSNIKLADAPGNVLLGARETGLSKRSVANISQVITIDTAFLDERVRSLPMGRLAELDAGLRLALSL